MDKMAREKFFISALCMFDEHASALQKLLYSILSTDSSPIGENGTRHSDRMSASRLALMLQVGDLRTVKKSLAALEKWGAIKAVKGGFHVFPWPCSSEEEEVEEGGVALEPGATEAPAVVCLAGYSDAKAVLADLKSGKLPGLSTDSVDSLVGSGIKNEDYSTLRKWVGQAASYAKSIDPHRVFTLQEMIAAKDAFTIS